MALPELAQALRTAASGGSLTLDARTLTYGTGVTLDPGFDVLVARAFGLRAGESWTLAITPDQIPAPGAEELRISAGRSTLARLGLRAATVDLRLRLPSGTTRLLVTAVFTLGRWSFSTSFRYMRGEPFDRLAFDAPAFLFAAQPVTAYPLDGVGDVALAGGLNLGAMLRTSGPIAQAKSFLPQLGDRYRFAGTVDVTAGRVMPAVQLRATLDGQLPPIGPLKVATPFLELRVQYTGPDRARSTALVLGMRLALPDGTSLDFTTQLRERSPDLVLTLATEADKPFTPDQLFALVGGESWGSSVPGPLRAPLQAVGLKDVEARVSKRAPPELRTLTTRVGSAQPLQLFDQFRLDEFDVVWILTRDGGGRWSNELQFVAWFEFYRDLFDGEFEVGITSRLQLWGSFNGSVSFARLLTTITGGVVTAPSADDYELTDFALSLDMQRRSWTLYLASDGVLDPLGTGLLVLGGVQFTLSSEASTESGRSYGAELEAALTLAGFPLAVTASYATADGWEFRAAMPPGASVTIQQFLQRLFPGAQVPDFLSKVRVSNVLLAAHSGGREADWVQTGAALQLRDIDLGFLGRYTLDANAELRHVGGRRPATSGRFSFGTTIPGIGARVTLGYSFSTDASQLVSVTWGAFRADYDITRSVLTFSVGEATLGGVLGQIVGLVIGDDGYRLPPPWNVLDSLSLRGFEIVFDFSRRPAQVSVRYRLSQPLDLGFLKLTGLEIGKVGDKLAVRLDATFLDGRPVPAFDPLQGPPTPPGRAPLDLRLLALGQRVTVPGIERSRTILDAIQVLAAFDDTPGDGLPRGPSFSASSPWLVGLHVLFVGETLDVAVVFVDPALYGLRIALAGEKAAIFDGLKFEILYKKVTDTVGVWQIRLTLPRSMRMLQFGALAITLPELGLDVYTNGDFRVDFGFPYDSDFSRSFGIQYFPFTGAGGFYFGKLSGQTATGLPRPSQPGAFDPVIEFGLGLQLGLGKDISAGILTAGISLTVFGIVEGVIAAWNPATKALPQQTGGSGDVATSYYYRVAGTIGIIGKIYGSVNFAIIKASVNLTVTISLQAVIEAHQPLLIAFQAKVDVSLSVEIDLWLFSITIHLTFSMTVRESFTLGSRTAAPWGAVGDGGVRSRLLDRAAAAGAARRRRADRAVRRAARERRRDRDRAVVRAPADRRRRRRRQRLDESQARRDALHGRAAPRHAAEPRRHRAGRDLVRALRRGDLPVGGGGLRRQRRRAQTDARRVRRRQPHARAARDRLRAPRRLRRRAAALLPQRHRAGPLLAAEIRAQRARGQPRQRRAVPDDPAAAPESGHGRPHLRRRHPGRRQIPRPAARLLRADRRPLPGRAGAQIRRQRPAGAPARRRRHDDLVLGRARRGLRADARARDAESGPRRLRRLRRAVRRPRPRHDRRRLEQTRQRDRRRHARRRQRAPAAARRHGPDAARRQTPARRRRLVRRPAETVRDRRRRARARHRPGQRERARAAARRRDAGGRRRESRRQRDRHVRERRRRARLERDAAGAGARRRRDRAAAAVGARAAADRVHDRRRRHARLGRRRLRARARRGRHRRGDGRRAVRRRQRRPDADRAGPHRAARDERARADAGARGGAAPLRRQRPLPALRHAPAGAEERRQPRRADRALRPQRPAVRRPGRRQRRRGPVGPRPAAEMARVPPERGDPRRTRRSRSRWPGSRARPPRSPRRPAPEACPPSSRRSTSCPASATATAASRCAAPRRCRPRRRPSTRSTPAASSRPARRGCGSCRAR